jgi:drug/metabolite transporter (DMT)-like permease
MHNAQAIEERRSVAALTTVLALLAAFFFAVATVCEQKGAMEEHESQALRPGFLLRLVHKPVWLIGLGADALGYISQAAALGIGRLVSVQPLLIASVVFALPLGAKITHQHIGRREIFGASLVCAGLVIFRLVATPYGGRSDATAAAWIIGVAIIGGLALVLVLASIGRSPGVRATLLGVAAGMVLGGIVAALTKATVDLFDQGWDGVFGDWHLYALAGAAVIGFTLAQASLQTGALAPAMTSETVLEALAGVAVGMFVLNERLDQSAAETTVSLLGLGLVVVGLLALARCRGAVRPRGPSKRWAPSTGRSPALGESRAAQAPPG